MIGKTILGRSFAGCVAYQFRKLEQHQGQLLLCRGVRDYNAAAMTQDFEQQRRLKPSLGRAVWHTAISFPPEETAQLTNDKMAAIARDYLTGMGLSQGQYVVIRHDDRLHPHFHIVANRVADSGQTVRDGLNYARSEKLLRQLEQKYELTPVLSQQRRRNLENVPQHEQQRIRLRETVQACVQTANSLFEFTQAVEAQGIAVQLHYSAKGQATGISFEQNGRHFKGSQLARSLSLRGISQLLEQQPGQEKVQQATRPRLPRATGFGY
ncbi:relaxase/mobilization nuclease domain-containing protein [Hymenobacter defluvii]|uniref:Relaxase/mobilization nuclease domain-containing protein n=1 Tax=Hymenobacter defluvii TaxID=2054411 RepID=A0ABS3TKN0_9BACT|nr:relaxase/mobilization nuclease domain-containing protein [Hymenobacter defluvii]MBO3273270.1 relaxase/mobilization nuclease domain-containing protein [Hymenobacter defluvii]